MFEQLLKHFPSFIKRFSRLQEKKADIYLHVEKNISCYAIAHFPHLWLSNPLAY